MLMRRVESPIFEQTRLWLAGDSHRVFHLVVDELHTYRGTAGTEVAYLLRLLLYRLGVTPDSPQVRFLSSSASLTDNVTSRQYLKEFFGVSVHPGTGSVCCRSVCVLPLSNFLYQKYLLEGEALL
jgi:DEAD/DEAH box helicase domain-containing protein